VYAAIDIDEPYGIIQLNPDFDVTLAIKVRLNIDDTDVSRVLASGIVGDVTFALPAFDFRWWKKI
jgi:hypothetical protein